MDTDPYQELRMDTDPYQELRMDIDPYQELRMDTDHMTYEVCLSISQEKTKPYKFILSSSLSVFFWLCTATSTAV